MNVFKTTQKSLHCKQKFKPILYEKIVFVVVFFGCRLLFAQTASGDIETYLNTYLDNIPSDSGNQYQTPTTTELATWGSIVSDILVNNIANARANANQLNYQITEYTNTSLSVDKIFYILEEQASKTHYWGTYVFSKNPDRNQLVLQAPHTQHDTNTGKQAIYCFKRLHNLALLLPGTHRCNNSSFSSCSGTTSTCSSSPTSFRISDMAHNTTTMFQKTTEVLYNHTTQPVFIQLHGFGKQASDPYVILSNGTNQTPTTDYALMLKNELLNADNSLTFKIAHLDNWTRLVGFTNTQGRMINQSSNPCNTAASTTTGRFIHVEQERIKLRQNSTGWEKMKVALSNVFSTTLSINSISDKLLFQIKNPFTNSISITSNKIIKIMIYSNLGKVIESKSLSLNKIIINTKRYKKGIYFLKLISNYGVFYKKMIKK